MKRGLIRVVDLGSGAIATRRSDTHTVDVPSGFDTARNVAALDRSGRMHYRNTEGRELTAPAMLRPLSWRVQGEHCLVEDDGQTGESRKYRWACVEAP
jgi:hypothetical protein